MKQIPYGRQKLDELDEEQVVSVLRGDWLTMGPATQKFENLLSTLTCSKTVSMSSGTAALHCAFKAIGLNFGDEVITPPITFIATQATAALLGAKIIFSDIDPETITIDPNSIEEKINERTKAIVVVDYAGHPGYLDELNAIAKQNGIFLIEDAAHSLGSLYKGTTVGGIADLTCFSFFPTKNITTGEGGAVCTQDSNLFLKVKEFAQQGVVRQSSRFQNSNSEPWYYEIHDFGLNYRLSDLHAALGISQLTKLEKFKKKRKALHDLYTANLIDIEEIVLPKAKDFADPFWHLYSIQVPAEKRLTIFKHLRNQGILVQVNYIPAYRQPVFRFNKDAYSKFPASEKFYASQISLPLHVGLEEEDVANICKEVRSALEK